jgi:hypothetical protein
MIPRARMDLLPTSWKGGTTGNRVTTIWSDRALTIRSPDL